MTHINTLKAGDFDLNHAGWKYYNTIKKKAMEQEFSWSGLTLSLSIAFFIVLTTAFALSFVNKAMIDAEVQEANNNIYRLEVRSGYLQNNSFDFGHLALLT